MNLDNKIGYRMKQGCAEIREFQNQLCMSTLKRQFQVI